MAVKRCKIGRAADLQSFRQEVALLAQLDHPGIVRLLAVKAVPPGAPIAPHACACSTTAVY